MKYDINVEKRMILTRSVILKTYCARREIINIVKNINLHEWSINKLDKYFSYNLRREFVITSLPINIELIKMDKHW